MTHIRSAHVRKLARTIAFALPPARLALNAGEGREDARACPHGPRVTCRHPRIAAAPATIVDRNLQDAQPRSRRAHLHFEIPSIGELAHGELEQRLAPDRPQRAHIGVAHAVKEPHAPTGHATGSELMPGDTSLLPPAARARYEHEIAAGGPGRGRRRHP